MAMSSRKRNTNTKTKATEMKLGRLCCLCVLLVETVHAPSLQKGTLHYFTTEIRLTLTPFSPSTRTM